MLFRSLVLVLVLGLGIASAAQAQGLRTEPPRELDGAWELVALNGQPLPLAPVREGGDPSECGTYGEYVGQRIGEGRLVLRVDEMWMSPRSGWWEGGVYMYLPEEIVCRAADGALVQLRRDVHNRAHPAQDVDAAWRAGTYGLEDSTASLAVADREWKLASSNGTGILSLSDEDGRTWTFRRAAPGPRFSTPGFVTVLGDYDGDGREDQVSVTPGRHGSGTMLARLASGAVERVADVPAGAEVMLAARGRVWRNADGRTLRLTDRDAVTVSVESAPERSDVTVFYLRNGAWVGWEYAPD